MDINNAASSRAAYYDRGAEGLVSQYEATNVPHGSTIRTTYTVPANRKAIVNGLSMQVTKYGVAGGVGIASAAWAYTPFGGGTYILLKRALITATLYDYIKETIGPDFVMYPGDELRLYTSDNSGGGTVNYMCSALYSEFDF